MTGKSPLWCHLLSGASSVIDRLPLYRYLFGANNSSYIERHWRSIGIYFGTAVVPQADVFLRAGPYYTLFRASVGRLKLRVILYFLGYNSTLTVSTARWSTLAYCLRLSGIGQFTGIRLDDAFRSPSADSWRHPYINRALSTTDTMTYLSVLPSQLYLYNYLWTDSLPTFLYIASI